MYTDVKEIYDLDHMETWFMGADSEDLGQDFDELIWIL